MRKFKTISVFLLGISIFFGNIGIGFAQKKTAPIAITKIEPMHWWVGMNNPTVEILVYGKGIGEAQISLNYANVMLEKVEKVENPNYVFLTLNISPWALAGNLPIVFKKGKQTLSVSYALKNKTSVGKKGIDNSDLMYLIFPDRFANGDPTNDVVKAMNDTRISRQKDSLLIRHGGDLQGVIDHIDYLKNMGVSSLWLNPVQECNQPFESYHGYAPTDHYTIDPRFGTLETYKTLVDKLHQNDMKMVMDVIYNHWGNEHYLFKDLPERNWIHQFDQFTRTNYRSSTLLDPYASQFDKTLMTDAWFDKHMPDINQKNKHCAAYFIQNAIWWIEETGIDAFRIDTYPYPDLTFMNNLIVAIKNEYPTFTIFGETWVTGVPTQAYFTKNNNIKQAFQSELESVTDFNLYYAVRDAVSKDFGWEDGVGKLYLTLTQDFLYQNANQNVTFLDNHDLDRILAACGKDLEKMRTALVYLMTLRGIPCLYYGTEILMDDYAGPGFMYVRREFEGGWVGDKNNKFMPEGRTQNENNMHDFIQKLAKYRRQNTTLQTGKLMQFVPQDGIYVYFRYDDKKTIMVVANNNKTDKTIDNKPYTERMKGFTKAKNIISDEKIDNIANFKIKANQALVFELQ